MFLSIALAFVPTQLPLGILEGFISAAAYRFVLARRPEFLGLLVKGGTL
jgi:cobalt/nickel transport system permease protein